MDQSIAGAGSSIADSLASTCACSVYSEVLGSSRGGVGEPFLCNLRELVGVSRNSVDPVGLRPGDCLGSLGFLSGVFSAVLSACSSSFTSSLFPSSSEISSSVPASSLPPPSRFPFPLSLPSFPSPGVVLLRALLEHLLSSLCLLALPWLLSLPSLLSPHWLLWSSMSHLVSALLASVVSSSLSVGSFSFPVCRLLFLGFVCRLLSSSWVG